MKNLFTGLRRPILVAGIGNAMKGDDAAGPELVKRIAAAGKAFRAVDCGGSPENYLDMIASSGAATILFADAAEMGEKPGTVRLYDTGSIAGSGISTHGISLGLLAEYIVQSCGSAVYLLGIQPASLRLGEKISPEVDGAVAAVADAILSLEKE